MIYLDWILVTVSVVCVVLTVVADQQRKRAVTELHETRDKANESDATIATYENLLRRLLTANEKIREHRDGLSVTLAQMAGRQWTSDDGEVVAFGLEIYGQPIRSRYNEKSH